jgi:hypothetical protein
MTAHPIAVPRNNDAGTRPPVRAALLLLGIVAVLNGLGGWLGAQIGVGHLPQAHEPLDALWLALALVYVLAMALPFVPGIEIGLGLMLLLGDTGILLVYLCTQLALALSFLAGRLVPVAVLAALFRTLKFERASQLLAGLAASPREERLQCLARGVAGRWPGRVLKHRYVALALMLNLPGNAVAGGAGGLGLLAGASRLFSFPRYCLLMAVATSPLPLLMLLPRVA